MLLDDATTYARVVTIRAFSAARWICLTFLVIQLPVTQQSMFELDPRIVQSFLGVYQRRFLGRGSRRVTLASETTGQTSENVYARSMCLEIDELATIVHGEWTFVSRNRPVVSHCRFHESTKIEWRRSVYRDTCWRMRGTGRVILRATRVPWRICCRRTVQLWVDIVGYSRCTDSM